MANLFAFSEQILYLLQLDIYALLCIIVSSLAFYLISTVKTKLGKYKYYLINITTWNLILCIDSAVITRKDFEDGVMNAPVIRGVSKFFGVWPSHFFTVVEHIATAQVGISIVVCCLFKFLHLAILSRFDLEFTLKKVVLATGMVHICSILALGKRKK